MEVEVDGVVYEAVNDIEQNGCFGCVAQDNGNLCGSISANTSCCRDDWQGVIWIKKEITASTNDLVQGTTPSTKEEKETLVEPSKGVKNDSGKIEWSYLPIEPMNEVLKVLMLGDRKYPSPDGCNWKAVPNARKRYYNAALRHITSWYNGEKTDPESGYNHLAHAVTNALFLLWFEIKGYPEDKVANKKGVI